MRVECITAEAELGPFAAKWEALWRRVPGATPFQSPAWLMPWWRHFGTGMPRILAVRAEGRLAGMLPLYELHEPGCRKLLPIGIGLSDYLDALVDPEWPEAGGMLMAAIGDVPVWQECHLPDLPSGSMLRAAPAPTGVQEDRQQTVPCPVLMLPERGEELAEVVPKKTLRDCRQAAARSLAAGGVMTEAAEEEVVPVFLDDLFRLHAVSWQARGEGGVLADPAVQAFHRDAAPGLAQAGMLRLFRLVIGGMVAAVYYGFACHGRAYAYIGGFDPELARFSPGAQILRHAIGDAIARRCREFHFLRGGESYKYAWGAVDRWNSARTLRRS